MHTKHPSIDYSSKAQIIKHITTISPHIHAAVFPLAFVVETINLGDLPRLVISSDKRDSIWVSDFEQKKEQECLDGIESSVNKVT
ncbi:hypothetical protein QFC19_003587 [Naganishia cerealis]|uniref:Uncharacterized protein n=1 Tax=Naganishia cerealis TaxID=610337 RepID=A0ACC2W086_9TREE|nr:hypothetical protein QFC19_003587 [Naganishia cerealis]